MKRTLKRASSLALTLAALAFGADARAQQGLEQAKMLFAAGAKAYEAGQFNAAIQAFEEANRLVPKPQIVFSIAQAQRRQYFLDKDPEHLRAAIKRYHEYVDAVKEGGRIADAAQALAELEPIAAKTAPDAAAARPAQKDPARVMVMTQVEDATISIDGKAAKTGMAVEVAPGKHRVSTTAPGYFDDVRDVQAVESALVPVDVNLREKPARIIVSGSSGASISIDGRPAGTTPLSSPIQVAPGTHLLTVTKNGYRAYSQELDLSKDEARQLNVHLEATAQRTVSYALMIGGGAAILAGGVFTAAALKNQSDAQKILDRQSNGTIGAQDLSDYDSFRGKRDDWTKAAIVAFAGGGVVAATGLVLYVFDAPVVSLPPARFEEKSKKPGEPKPSRDMDLSFAPFVSPSFAGGAVGGRF